MGREKGKVLVWPSHHPRPLSLSSGFKYHRSGSDASAERSGWKLVMILFCGIIGEYSAGLAYSRLIRYTIWVVKLDIFLSISDFCIIGRGQIYPCEVFWNNRRILGSCLYSLVLARELFKSRLSPILETCFARNKIQFIQLFHLNILFLVHFSGGWTFSDLINSLELKIWKFSANT